VRCTRSARSGCEKRVVRERDLRDLDGDIARPFAQFLVVGPTERDAEVVPALGHLRVEVDGACVAPGLCEKRMVRERDLRDLDGDIARPFAQFLVVGPIERDAEVVPRGSALRIETNRVGCDLGGGFCRGAAKPWQRFAHDDVGCVRPVGLPDADELTRETCPSRAVRRRGIGSRGEGGECSGVAVGHGRAPQGLSGCGGSMWQSRGGQANTGLCVRRTMRSRVSPRHARYRAASIDE
jgi:hypothetical protein